jgi:hypothetical protein
MALIIVIQNQSNLAPISDYDYKVIVGDGSPERSHLITKGLITGHTRADGWQKLVAQLLAQEPA